ncbi:MAG: hypothetical protein Q7S64_02220 [bacterium]|nr:hypothetical protein [bacterium]
MALEITVSVLKRSDGSVNGISFVAGFETYAEDFVGRFGRALQRGEATIVIRGNVVVLDGPTFNGTRDFEFRPTPEELAGLQTSIFAEGATPAIRSINSLAPGFQLTVE